MKKLFPLLALVLLTACQKPLDQRIADEAKQWTETNCPKTIDAVTRMDSMTYDIPSKTVQYWYTASGEADNAFYWQQMNANSVLRKKQIADQLRVNTEVKELVEHQCNFQYIYHSASTGAKLYSLLVTPEDYK